MVTVKLQMVHVFVTLVTQENSVKITIYVVNNIVTDTVFVMLSQENVFVKIVDQVIHANLLIHAVTNIVVIMVTVKTENVFVIIASVV